MFGLPSFNLFGKQDKTDGKVGEGGSVPVQHIPVRLKCRSQLVDHFIKPMPIGFLIFAGNAGFPVLFVALSCEET